MCIRDRLRDFSGVHRFELAADTAEICVRIKGDGEFGIRVLESEDGREYTDIIVEPQKGTMKALLRNSSLLEEVDKNLLQGTFRKRKDGAVEVDILVDCSVIEAVSYTHLDVYKRQAGGISGSEASASERSSADYADYPFKPAFCETGRRICESISCLLYTSNSWSRIILEKYFHVTPDLGQLS